MSLREELRKQLLEDTKIDTGVFLKSDTSQLEELAALYNIDFSSKIDVSNQLVKILEIKKNEYKIRDSYFIKISDSYTKAFLEESDINFDEDYLKNIEMEYERLKTY